MKKIIPVLLLVLMVVIFLLSAQPADDSSLTSSHFAEFFAHILFHNYDSLSPEFQKEAVSGLTFIVRKTAHFSEYALLGFLWYLFLKNTRNGMFFSLALTFLYAVSDEFHQLFVAGRSGQFRDVMLDTTGGLFGILVAFVLLCIAHCTLHKEIVHFGTWSTENSAFNKQKSSQ